MRRAFAVLLMAALALGNTVGFASAATVIAPNLPGQDPGKIVGVMKDANGKPLQNATVNITDKAGNIIATATTDANGLFSVTVNPGTYSVTVTAAGTTTAVASTATVAVTAGATTTIAAGVTAAGALAVTAGSAGFIAALGGPIVAAALVAGGVVGAVAIQQALEESSPSR